MKNNGKNILLFAGTSEGRLLAEQFSKWDVNAYVSVATEYGMESMETIPNVHFIAGRMNQTEMEELITSYGIDLVIDATHPYAQVVTENIKAACSVCKTEYMRCLRETSNTLLQEETGYVMVDSVAEAVKYLQNRKGNIFITTGSKELKRYTEIAGYKERCYARVLSTPEAVEESVAQGFKGAHLIAMQGPFSEELNIAMLEYTKASYFVTKESGKAGGFQEKLDAAKATGVTLIVIGRPVETGHNVEQVKAYIQNILTMDCKGGRPFCKGD